MGEPGPKGRDGERKATYLAEGEAFDRTPMARRLTFAEASSLVARVVAHDWWRIRGCDPAPVEVVEGRSAHTSWWRAADRRIQLSPADLRIATVTHELAHAVDADTRDSPTSDGYTSDLDGSHVGGPAHGPTFRRAHVDVIALVAGSVPSGQLLDAYRNDGLVVAAGDAVSAVAGIVTILDPRPFETARFL